ncbi:site-specific DNA-methyltransferase [Helicobacter pylori]
MQNKEICGEKSVNEKNLEVFNRYFPGCLSIENDDKLTLDAGRLKALLGDFSEIKEEGYGLDFVGKKIALNEAFKKNNKILKPLNESTSKHILIKGDNLDALKILKQSYSEKIKMIYIDPPYNTKNDNFIYSDDFSQSNEETLKQLDYSKEKLDYIKNLFGSKCHSGWLSFMYPRLLLAKDLLRQDGVIFISIDDNECANLKLLCDEIFGEGNFIETFLWNKTQTPPSASNKTRKTHEFILCYQKNKDDKKMIAKFSDGGDAPLWNETNSERILTFPANYVFSNLKDGIYEKGIRDKIEVLDDIEVYNGKIINSFRLKGHFRWKQETLNEEIINNVFLVVKSDKFSIRYCREGERIVMPANEISKKDNVGTNETASKELLKLFDDNKIFNFNKPVSLIKYLIAICSNNTNSNDIILDFFAGSGTTAHAVLESNKSDYQKLSEGGGLFNGLNAEFKERRFILVQLDEKIDPKKNKSAHDFCLNTLKSASPSIFDITEERIKRAGAKIKEDCPPLDVGFQAFEIIDDETHANDKNLGEAHQKDLLAYSNPEKKETQTILIKLLCCEGLELTTPITCLIENALYLAKNMAFIVGDIEMSGVLENLKDKGVEKISMYMPAISNDRLCLELGSNLFDLKLESGDLKIRG